MKQVKNFLVNAALFSAACVLCLVGLEMGLRWFYPQMIDIRNIIRLHPKAMFSVGANLEGMWRTYDFTFSFSTDSLGLRGKEPRFREGEIRVLGVGDSMTFGMGVEDDETYLALLEKILQSRGYPCEVLNGAVPGYGTHNVLAFLPELEAHAKPDLVILGAFPENDVSEILYDRMYTLEEGELRYNPNVATLSERFTQGSAYLNIKRYLKFRSHAYIFVRNKTVNIWWPLVPWLSSLSQKKGEGETRPAVNDNNPYARPATPYMEQGWNLLRYILREMRDYLSARGIKFFVVGIPSGAQPRIAECFQGKAGTYEIDMCYPMERFQEISLEEGIPFVSLLPVFREAHGQGDSLFFPRDGHLTAAGHRLAAQTLADPVMDCLQAPFPEKIESEEKDAP